MNKITVTGNIVSKNGIVLFLADGTSQVLPQDSFRTQAILDTVLPSLARSTPIEIDLDDFSISKAIEQATGGAVKVDETAGNFAITTRHGKIEDGHALRAYIEDAARNGGGKGLKLFIATFAEMARTRKHSADELLTFMKDADLPIADDGSIIGYKVLIEKDNGLFDPHSKTVQQNLGSLVFMPASKVNDDRRLLCSIGLHVAARQYLRDFWYHANPRLCLVKINPDNVISVPQGEHSKMRVCAYHIVKVFSKEDGHAIVNGTPIARLPAAAQMLADAIVGNHIPIIRRVEVGEKGVAVVELAIKAKPRKAKPTRKLRTVAGHITVARVKEIVADATPYAKKLAKAQRFYDDGMSIRDVALKLKMDRESLGKNLVREAGR